LYREQQLLQEKKEKIPFSLEAPKNKKYLRGTRIGHDIGSYVMIMRGVSEGVEEGGIRR
jgi:hypothetical protein